MASKQSKATDTFVEQVAVDELRFDPRNARKHDQPSIDAIAASLREFGQQKPIVATADGTVIAGNGILAAARVVGMKSVMVMRTSLDGEALARFAIADNRVAELSAWDYEALLASLQQDDTALIPGVDDDFMREVEAIVTGRGFDTAPASASDDTDVPRKGGLVKVRLWDETTRPSAIAAIREVLDRFPEWKAVIE